MARTRCRASLFLSANCSLNRWPSFSAQKLLSMSDDSPTPWPPAPTAAADALSASPPENRKAGWASLVLIAIGIANTLFWYQDGTARDAAKPWRPAEIKAVMEIVYPLYFLPFWSVLALISGAIGRRSIPGKVGIILSIAALAGTALAAVELWSRYRMRIW